MVELLQTQREAGPCYAVRDPLSCGCDLPSRIRRSLASCRVCMSSDDERLVRAFFDRIWGAEDESAAGALFDPDFRHHDLVTGAETGLGGFLASIRSIRNLFSELEFAIHDLVAADGRVATRWEAIGAHGVSGREIRVDGMSFDHIRQGWIVENWTVWDRQGLANQLAEDFG